MMINVIEVKHYFFDLNFGSLLHVEERIAHCWWRDAQVLLQYPTACSRLIEIGG